MGTIVSAYATSHILFGPQGVEERAARVVAGMRELGRRAAAAQPDVILMIVSEHMFNINTSLQPPFCVGLADRYMPFGDMGIPVRSFRGHRDFAQGLVRCAAPRGFDLATVEELVPDHGITLPLLFVKPWDLAPVVPLFVNINMDPVPSPARCWALAEVIRDYIATQRPAGERVAVVGSGGLSHWLNIPGMGNVAADYDHEVIATIAEGRAESIAALSAEALAAKAGNGGLEIMNWMMMAATVPGKKGEAVYYEAMNEWFTGMGGVAMRL